METEVVAQANGDAWRILPQSMIALVVLVALSLYFMVRQMMFTLMIMDVTLGFFRIFGLVPKQGKRMNAFLHWLVAVSLFAGYFMVAEKLGWLAFVPV
ncbi:hypothetical protein [Leisingera sp. S232]|uniref:hypothetical protein n=1 Tax=Leisingera sp. S232 TaxID=3415132 RepID=UPI003C7CF44A